MQNSDSSSSTTSTRAPAPRRIAFCITDLDSGGAEKALVQLVTRLDRATWDPIVFCLGPEGELAATLRQQGISVDCYGARTWRDLGVFFWLARQLKRAQPQLLQCFLFHGNLVGRLAAKAVGISPVVAGHRVAEREQLWHLRLDRWTRGFVDHHVCVSQGVANHVRDQLHLASDQISVIPNGVTLPDLERPAEPWPAELVFPVGTEMVLAVGRLHPQKGFLELLAAFEQLYQLRPTARLAIIGEGPQRTELEQVIHSRGLQNLIVLPGRRQDVLDLMRQSRVFALSSRWEGLPNVMLEAMGCGLPVVAFDIEGVRDVITNEKQGLIVTQGDIRGFAVAMNRMLSDRDLAQRVGSSAQFLVEKRFTWESMAQAYEELYLRLID